MATDLGVKVTEDGKYYFISYNTEDAELVSSYLKKMADYGLPIWYDYGIPQGDLWQTVIAEKIYNCESVIMFLSSKLFKKENSFVKKEWSIAKGRPKKVYIVILDQIDETSIPPQYAFWWSDIKDTQSIQAGELEVETCVDKILDAVGFEKQNNHQEKKNYSSDSDYLIEEGMLKAYKGKASVAVIPHGVISIGDRAFDGCCFVTRIDIPDTVTSIGDTAFFECTSLTSINIPDSVTSLGGMAFYKCSALKSIAISKSLTSIEKYTFQGCSSCKRIVIPDGVKSLGACAFYGCSSLSAVVIPKSVTSIDYWAFIHCNSLCDVFYTGSKDDWNRIDIGLDNKCLTNARIHYDYGENKNENQDIFVIESDILKEYNGNASVVEIPYGITSIGVGAFSVSHSLKRIV
ncbi:MAG: leucine-rich repeat protein, partial [Clostridia bacterium]|nr:leucine-rich repeat protein [Clostridia bacterium]